MTSTPAGGDDVEMEEPKPMGKSVKKPAAKAGPTLKKQFQPADDEEEKQPEPPKNSFAARAEQKKTVGSKPPVK